MELDPSEAAARFAKAANSLPGEVTRTERQAVADAHRSMTFWTSGGESLKALRKADHPHARRHGSRRRSAVIVNRQSGAFQSSLTVEPPAETGDGTAAALFFTAEHGRYLFDPEASRYDDGGTEMMFGRDLPGQVVADVEDDRAERFDAMIANLFR